MSNNDLKQKAEETLAWKKNLLLKSGQKPSLTDTNKEIVDISSETKLSSGSTQQNHEEQYNKTEPSENNLNNEANQDSHEKDNTEDITQDVQSLEDRQEENEDNQAKEIKFSPTKPKSNIKSKFTHLFSNKKKFLKTSGLLVLYISAGMAFYIGLNNRSGKTSEQHFLNPLIEVISPNPSFKPEMPEISIPPQPVFKPKVKASPSPDEDVKGVSTDNSSPSPSTETSPSPSPEENSSPSPETSASPLSESSPSPLPEESSLPSPTAS